MAYSSVQNPITLTGRGEGGNSPPTIPMSTTRTCPYVSKTPSPSVFVLDSCRVPSVFNNALASRDYSYIPGALCFYIYLDIRWQRLPLQNCNCITEIKKKKKKSKVWTLGYVNSIEGETDGGVPVSDGGWRERERNTRTGETGGITIFFFFFFTRERDFWLDIFVVKGVEGWRIDEYYSVIVTARYGLLYVPGEIYSPWKNMYMLDGILG